MGATALPRSIARRHWSVIAVMAGLSAMGIVLRFGGIHPAPWAGAVVFGASILAAAFLLAWSAETAELDIPQGMAIAIIAFIAVLPEYAVDLTLAWRAGADPTEAAQGLAIANMTGANRLLIGVGWPLLLLVVFYRTRKGQLVVGRHSALELAFLLIACIYAFSIPLRNTLTVVDSIVLISLFVMYVYFTSKTKSEEVELVGPSRTMGNLSDWRRRGLIIGLIAFCGVAVFSAAEPFAEALIEIGRQLGVSEFLLIQWLGPLASEAPEFLVAAMLVWRGRAAAGMAALISSKVNQWTLLVGALPIAFLVSAGEFQWSAGLPLDGRQQAEIFLTAAQSVFAIAVFVNLRMTTREALLLFVLFGSQLFIPGIEARVYYSIGYLILAGWFLVRQRREAAATARTAWEVARGKPEAPSEAGHGGQLSPTEG